MKYIGVLSVQGLPARYGAFEQTIDQLVRHAAEVNSNLSFMVATNRDLAKERYEVPIVKRLFFKRRAKAGVIIYGLKSFFSMYIRGVRTYLVMGYGLAPFFWLFEGLGCKLVCNVDGFEWRRAKWGKLARRYFRLCESFAVRSHAELIFDSIGVARYYKINHRRTGHILFYGTEHSSAATVNLGSVVGLAEYYVVVMRMEPENHILEIVSAFLTSHARRHLVLIGPSTEFFQRAVKPLIESDRTGRIRWLGAIYDREKLQALRAAASAYIHGHSVGGTNPTLVEACWLSRPVIAYGSIFNREVLGTGATYFHNQEELTEIFNHEERQLPIPPRLGERYTWKYICEGYLRLLS